MRGELGLHLAGGAEGVRAFSRTHGAHAITVQGVKVLAHGGGRFRWINFPDVPVHFRCRILLVGIGLDQTGINGHALATDQSLLDAACDGRFEQVAQQFAVAETPVPVLGKGRVVRDAVAQIETAEPAICQVQMDLFAQPPLRPDAEAIADQQHPDQKLRINRRASCVAVEIGQIAAEPGQIDEPVDGAQQVVLRDMILQRELVEQRRLRLLPRSPSSPILPTNAGIESARGTSIKHEFFNGIGRR